MESVELWRRIIAIPHDKSLRSKFVQALEQENDWKAQIFSMYAEYDRLYPAYLQYQEVEKQLNVLLDRWRVDFEAFTNRWNAKIGFVKAWPLELTIAARDFALHAPEIVATLPIIHLNLREVNEAPEVFEVAQLKRIWTIAGGGQPWSDEAITALATSNMLTTLRWLSLCDAGITEEQVDILAANSGLKRIQHIELFRNLCRDPVDAAAGCGIDGVSGQIVPESVWLPEYGLELEARHGYIEWLHYLGATLIMYPSRYAV